MERGTSLDMLRFQFTHPGGVRLLSLTSAIQMFSFNSRTREGCDLYLLPSFHILSAFQFTHPGGVRHARSLI